MAMATPSEVTATATAATEDFAFRADHTFGECRQRLISYLIKLNRALSEDLTDLSRALLARFCDSLVDYLSAGYFRVFQRVSLPGRSYAVIEATTQAGMSFNDRFGDVEHAQLGEVREALEKIARVLSTRFELEDDLLRSEGR